MNDNRISAVNRAFWLWLSEFIDQIDDVPERPRHTHFKANRSSDFPGHSIQRQKPIYQMDDAFVEYLNSDASVLANMKDRIVSLRHRNPRLYNYIILRASGVSREEMQSMKDEGIVDLHTMLKPNGAKSDQWARNNYAAMLLMFDIIPREVKDRIRLPDIEARIRALSVQKRSARQIAKRKKWVEEIKRRAKR